MSTHYVEYLVNMPTRGEETEALAVALCSEIGATHTVTDCSVAVVAVHVVSFFVTFTGDAAGARAACVRARGAIEYDTEVITR